MNRPQAGGYSLNEFRIEINLRACQDDRYRARFLCMLGLLAKFGLVNPGHLRFSLRSIVVIFGPPPTISSFTFAVVLIRFAG